MAEFAWPWETHGGSFVWGDAKLARPRPSVLPSRCCEAMDPEQTGRCREGCCDDYRCRACGKTWRYEWPD